MSRPHPRDEAESARALRARVLSATASARPQPGETGTTAVLNRLCRTIVRELDTMGAAVNLMAGPSHAQAVVGMSDTHSAAVDDLQFTVGEGPCHDALRTERPVHSADLASETRWPGYSSVARELGVRAVYALPLQVGAVSLGVLDVFDSRPRDLDAAEWALTLAFADLATESLLHRAGTDTAFIDPGLRTALGSRAQVWQAQGMIGIDNDVSLNDAMVCIRAYAYGNRRAISDVAHDVVHSGLRIPVETGGGTDPRPATG